MKAVVVPIGSVEAVRAEFVELNVLDRSRKIVVVDSLDGRIAEIPVLRDVSGFTVVEQSTPEFYRSTASLKEHLIGIIPDEIMRYVPSSWQLIGDIIITHIPAEIRNYRTDIAEKLLLMNPRCNCVVQDLGIKGPFREPEREIIIGDKTETIQKENGCLFKIDVMKLMFSKGNLAEKKRMSKLGKDEVVVDMFAGIGYFSIPLAVHGNPKKVYSIELNPVSHGYLLENIRLNHQEDVIEAINGNCKDVTPVGIADRVIMGYVGTTHEYLQQGISAIKKEGGILHYHETTPECLVFDRPIQRIKNAASALGRDVEIMGCYHIKKYSPGVWHVVVDAFIK
ncbi:class I SAM-dependent methyltransferase [Methanococcoides alaskense]|uniref:tRNA(Phe) (4-demethylwyosine(37)-C(7)) aminocarboxypropyltransferase n=1 Tax=Methanococcoides alaskense TaxID=325778 RepID=A0AA90U0T3_9EURY|nr:class I SAM-dependent methyltransferase family protein [Methanococcoides alaskense]MDR6223547.1 tRNA wybutosine-synthesizing protein 2 [Methanococcoides alaskense]